MDFLSEDNFDTAIIPDWHKKVKFFFSDMIWIIMAFLIVPTILIGLVQNSVPGDNTYQIKTGMENAFLAVVKIFNKQAGFQIDYTERRYQEAMKVLVSKYGVKSMDSLLEQIVATEDSIKSVDNPEERRQLAEEYINTLMEVNSGLENKKLEIASGKSSVATSRYLSPTSVKYSITTNTSSSTSNSTVSYISPTPIPQSQSNQDAEISSKISDTQKQIDATVKDMKDQTQTFIPSSTVSTPVSTAVEVQPTSTPFPSPVPTLIPSLIPSLAPTAVPTSTLAPTPFWRHPVVSSAANASPTPNPTAIIRSKTKKDQL